MPLKCHSMVVGYTVLCSKNCDDLDRPSHLAVTCGNGCVSGACPRFKRPPATVLCNGLPGVAGGACGPAFPPRGSVGDGQGQGFELGGERRGPGGGCEP